MSVDDIPTYVLEAVEYATNPEFSYVISGRSAILTKNRRRVGCVTWWGDSVDVQVDKSYYSLGAEIYKRLDD